MFVELEASDMGPNRCASQSRGYASTGLSYPARPATSGRGAAADLMGCAGLWPFVIVVRLEIINIFENHRFFGVETCHLAGLTPALWHPGEPLEIPGALGSTGKEVLGFGA